MPTVSAIIPVYNRFDFLHESLSSVFGQTRPPDEVLVVDDCSTESLDDYFRCTPAPGPVTIVRTDRNRRVAGARNWGWRHARGELVAFLDSDDTWEPRKLELQLATLAQRPELDGVYGAMTAFFPDGRTQAWADDRPEMVDARAALVDANITVQTLLMKRVALESLGGFDERFGILDDQDIAIRMALAGQRVLFIADPPLVRHRRNDTNYSSKAERFFAEDLQIIWKHRALCNALYGAGSDRVHLARALRRLGGKRRALAWPARALARVLSVTAPSSRMPRG